MYQLKTYELLKGGMVSGPSSLFVDIMIRIKWKSVNHIYGDAKLFKLTLGFDANTFIVVDTRYVVNKENMLVLVKKVLNKDISK